MVSLDIVAKTIWSKTLAQRSGAHKRRQVPKISFRFYNSIREKYTKIEFTYVELFNRKRNKY